MESNFMSEQISYHRERSRNNKSQLPVIFRKLFLDALREIYWAEIALINVFPKMIDHVSSSGLSGALNDHLEATIIQVARLDRIFDLLCEEAEVKKCDAMEGLIKDTEEIMKSKEIGIIRDSGILLATQKVKHYKIVNYGRLRAFATTLNEDEIAALFSDILTEEKEAEERLTEIAESSTNIKVFAETEKKYFLLKTIRSHFKF